MTRRKPGEPRQSTATPPLPEPVGKVWTAFIDELGACLADSERERSTLYQLAEVAREQSLWPSRGLDDEYLISGLIRLCFAYSMAGERRRGWLRKVLAPLHEVAEGMIDTACSLTVGQRKALEAEAARAALPAVVEAGRQVAKSTAPQPGQRGYRADIDG